MTYSPLYIKANETGLVQNRVDHILPDDAYPVLENAYLFRETIRRKFGLELVGQLQRIFTNFIFLGVPGGLSFFGFTNILVTNLGVSGEPNAMIIPGSVSFTFSAPDAATFIDNGNGGFIATGNGTSVGSTINYVNGNIILSFISPTIGGGSISLTLSYAPGLPVMGIKIKENQSSINDTTVFWDTKYAYIYDSTIGSFREFIPGTTWTGSDFEFFWATNYWVDTANNKIFWATNFSSINNDPIRYTNGVSWVNFTPQVDNSGNLLLQALAILPFRGRLVAFDTREGMANPGLQYSNRIRWSAIGTPFTTIGAISVAINGNAWRDDVRGQGGFLNIPTNEDIISVGFVRDNLVIFCERSTWQLRYTGRTIAPFQIERVNSELGALGLNSAIQFDTSLLAFGDKAIIECDSFKADAINVKIPDLIFNINYLNNGPDRIGGIRDFVNRLAYWIYPSNTNNGSYPNQRLVYNYENDSWAIFTDSLTALGTFQKPTSRTWLNTPLPWIEYDFSWINQPLSIPTIVGGNQQGFISYIGGTEDEITTNDVTLFITNITTTGSDPTIITSPNHNLQPDYIIQIENITGTPFNSLNDGIFQIVIMNSNQFTINMFNSSSGQFDIVVSVPDSGYNGGGQIRVRDNFRIQSKKFNFVDEGQNIQMGYLDILTNTEKNGAFSLNIYADYNDQQSTNAYPDNQNYNLVPDTFFNTVIPTSQSSLNTSGGTRLWQRVICPSRANFLTLEYTFSNAQMAGEEQELNVEISSQVLWIRRAGRLSQI